MTFTQALSAIFDDSARVTRRTWNNRRVYCSAVEQQLCITGFSSSEPDDGKPHPWVVTESDYYADDWEVVE